MPNEVNQHFGSFLSACNIHCNIPGTAIHSTSNATTSENTLAEQSTPERSRSSRTQGSTGCMGFRKQTQEEKCLQCHLPSGAALRSQARSQNVEEEVLQRIADETGLKSGDPQMFKYYQGTVNKVVDEMPANEMEIAKETAEKWSNDFPPSPLRRSEEHTS